MEDQIRKDVSFYREHYSDAFLSATAAAVRGRLRKPLGALDPESREETQKDSAVHETDDENDTIDWKVFRNTVRYRRDSQAMQFCVRVELKFRSESAMSSGQIFVDLSAGQFERLSAETMNSQYLVAVVGPDQPEDWLEEGDSALSLNGRAYWTSLRGAAFTPSPYSTKRKPKARVTFDPTWRFTSDVMNAMLWAALRLEVLNHD